MNEAIERLTKELALQDYLRVQARKELAELRKRVEELENKTKC